MKKIAKLFATALLTVVGTAAQAAILNVTIGATVTENAGGALEAFVPMGSSLSFTVLVDTDNLDANGAAGAYTATDNSNVDTFLVVPVTGTSAITTLGSTAWSSVGALDLTSVSPGLYLPYVVNIDGTGMTPDQILPDFASLIGGLITVDMSPLGIEGGQVIASVNSVSINAVPVPAAAWLFGSSVLGLAGVARRRRAA